MKKKGIVLAASFLIPFGLLILFSLFSGIAPFGDRTFLYDDMKRQYVLYYAYYKNLPESISSGLGNIFYSLENGLGGSMAGFFAYYLTSPLLLLFFFLPLEFFPSAVTLLTVTKLSLMSVTMCVYLKEKAGEYSFLLLPFSLAYALSANPVLNCTNSMWLDALILFPLLLLFAERFLNDHKRPFSGALPYILCTAGLLYVNYYIAWMALLFTALWGILVLAGQIRSGNLRDVLKKALSFASSTVLAGMLSGFLLLPAFFSLQRSAKNVPGGGADRLLFLTVHETINDLSPLSVLSKLAIRSFDTTQIFDGAPAVYAGVLLLFPFLLYFGTGSVPVRERLRNLILILILFVSFCLSFLNRIWHAGSAPSGYHYRYSFLFSFLMIVCSFEVVRRLHKSDEPVIRFPAVLVSGILLLCFFVVIFSVPFSYLDPRKKMITLILTLISAALLFLLFLAHKKAGGPYSALLLLCFSVILAGELLYNFSYNYQIQSGGFLTDSGFRKMSGELASFSASLKKDPERPCRYTLPAPLSENDPLLGGFPGISVYTSVTPFSDRIFLKNLGFHDNGLFTEAGTFHTKGSSLILSLNEDGDPLSMALSLPEGSLLEGPVPDHEYPDPYAYTEAYLSAFTGRKEKIFEEASVSLVSENDSLVTYSVTPAIDGSLSLYVIGSEEAGRSVTVSVNDGEPLIFGSAAFCGILSLGDWKAGEPLTVSVHADDETAGPIRPLLDGLLIMTENEKAVSDLRERLRRVEGTFRAVTSSHFEGTVPGDGAALVLSLPYDPGFTLRINGRRVPLSPYADTFLSARIPEEMKGMPELTFTLRYIPEGLIPGLFITALGLILFLILILCERRAGNDPD